MTTHRTVVALALAVGAMVASTSVRADEPLTASQIVERVLSSDPWGLSGARISAHIVMRGKGGSTRELAFHGKAMQYDPPLAKSIVRFSAPADLAGAAFLQIQKQGGDDERFLFLPELKRSRRIAGSLRSSPFMGTDFSYADLDRRDIRYSRVTLKGSATVGKFACHRLELVPKDEDSQYSRMEVWVRKDNFLPLQMKMYDRAGVLFKTFVALEIKRVRGQWFISRSRMENHRSGHRTELFLDKITVQATFPESEFSVRALEKL